MEVENYIQFLLALVFVLSLIGLLAWAVKRFGLIPGVPRASGPSHRLSVVEATNIDPKRRLVLVRRDDIEHLILLGPDSMTVVETGINPLKTPGGGESKKEPRP